MTRITSVVLASVLSCLLTLGIFYAAGLVGGDAATYRIEHSDAVQASRTNYVAPNGAAPFDFTFAAEKVAPAVVFIRNTMNGNSRQANVGPRGGSPEDFFRQFFGDEMPGRGQGSPRQAPRSAVGAGSGVLISPDGYIVTNNHVIDNALDLEVRVGDRDIYKAVLVGTDPTTDIALLKIDADNPLPYLEFANSDQVRIGQWVAAVGNPFELATTVTAGIVSAKGRSINIIGSSSNGDPRERDRTAIESFIQTDAAVNPGNSGGALVNLEGQLIGINTAIASPTGAFAGYSFAVPGELVRKVADDLREYGTVQRGFIGASIVEINQAYADEKDLSINYGVYIDSLTDGSSAKEAGLRSGDIITAIDGIAVRTSPDLLEQVGRHRPGDVVELTYVRRGKEASAKVTLKGADGSTKRVRSSDLAGASKGFSALGIQVEELEEGLQRRLRLEGGVKVTSVTSGRVASQTDMAPGFIITKVGDRRISSVDDLRKAIDGAKGIVVVRGRYESLPGEKIYAFDPS